LQEYKGEIFWKTESGNIVFGGMPVARTGKEQGLISRLNLLKDLSIGKKVLSVGCGICAELNFFRRANFFTLGLDPVRRFLLEAKKNNYSDNFVQTVGEHLPFRNDTFDLVLQFEVLEHVKNLRATLEETYRILKPKGLLFVTVPNRFFVLETHGIQVSPYMVIQLLGIGVPFFSMFPNFLRRKFERARIFTQAEIVTLLKERYLEPVKIEYLMPPLDQLKNNALTNAMGNVFFSLRNVPVIKMLGANIMVLCVKKENSQSGNKIGE
jgi:SAM-dependent methyltransferase